MKRQSSPVLFRVLMMVMMCCCALPLLTSCEKRNTIVNGIDEKEANEILVFLDGKGISASKVKSAEAGGGGAVKLVLWDISVPTEDASTAMYYLNQAGLPRRQGQSLLGIFTDSGLVPSELQEKIRYQAGLRQELANIIRKIDGVLDADVQISFPEEDPLNPGATKGKITASVYVKHSGALDDPNKHLQTKIKRLVQGSITGLSYDDITIIPDRAGIGEVPKARRQAREEAKDYVSVWTVIVAKESLTRFRLIFFSFILMILLLFVMMIWIGWKVYPVFKEHGGISALFQLKPIVEAKEKSETEAKGEEEEHAEEEAPEEGEPTDQGVT